MSRVLAPLLLAAAVAAPVLAQPPIVASGVAEARAHEDLAALRLRYGPRHPEVITTERRLEVRRGDAARALAAEPEAYCRAIEERVRELEARVLESATRYGPRHPEQRALRARAAALAPFRCAH